MRLVNKDESEMTRTGIKRGGGGGEEAGEGGDGNDTSGNASRNWGGGAKSPAAKINVDEWMTPLCPFYTRLLIPF